MTNFITDYEKAVKWLENKWVSAIPFDVNNTTTSPSDDDLIRSLVWW
jgi:hypothetical protein